MGLAFPEELPEDPGVSEVLLPPDDVDELPPGVVDVLLPPGDMGDAAEVCAEVPGVCCEEVPLPLPECPGPS